MDRVLHEELLDEDRGSKAEVLSALRSLRWVNLLFGGNRMHRRLLLRVAQQARLPQLALLEVASGHACALQAAALWLRKHRVRLAITLLDRSCQHLPGPAEWKPELPPPALVTADALRIPREDRSFDVVSSCLFFHHLSENEAQCFLRESLRVARVAVVINDLERGWMHYLLSRLASLLDPSRISRHDGPVSVRQAYTRQELRMLLAGTGHSFEIRRGFLFRFGAILWCPGPAPNNGPGRHMRPTPTGEDKVL